MINPVYLKKEIGLEMNKVFKNEGVIKLSDFLNSENYLNLSLKLWNAKGRRVLIPDKCSFEELQERSVKEFVSSKDFTNLINKIIGKEARVDEIIVKRMGWRDFTLIHDEEKEINKEEKIEFFFFISGKWDSKCGGSKIYNHDGKTLVFSPESNSLCIIKKKRDMNSFIKYINHFAGKEKFIVVEGRIR